MNKKAKEAIQAKVKKEQLKIRDQLNINKREMKQLVENQTALKRELAEWSKFLNDTFGKGK